MSAEPLIRGGRQRLALAAMSAVVLVLGYVLAPPRPATPPSPEHAAPMLEQRVEERAPARLFRSVQEGGLRALASVVTFPTLAAPVKPGLPDLRLDVGQTAAASEPEPAGFGLLLQDRLVLTHADALGGAEEPSAVLPDGRSVTGTVVAFDTVTGLVLIQLKEDGGAVAVVSTTVPEAGEMAVAAGRRGAADFIVPLFVSSVTGDMLTLSAAGAATRPGLPVFSLSGEALAVAVGPRSPTSAHVVAAALARLDALRVSPGARSGSLGMVLQAPTPALRDLLGPGVPVADLLPGSPAEAVGLRPGDVVTTIAETPVDTIEAAQAGIAALPRGVDAVLTVRRGGDDLRITVRPRVWLPAPVTRAAAEHAVPLSVLLADHDLAALGLPPGATVLAVDGLPPPREPGSLSAPRLRRRRGLVLQVASGETRFLAALPRQR